MLNKSLILSILLTLVVAMAAYAKTPVTIYGDHNYPPYSYAEGGKAKGIYTEILQRAFSRMKDYDVSIELVPWARGLNFIETGSGLALYPPYEHRETRPWMDPYSVPILDETVVIFCTEDSLPKSRTRWPEDYYGLTIGLNLGFKLGGEQFWQAVEERKIRVEEATGSRPNILKLGANRIDCYMNDRISVLWELDRLKKSGEYKGKDFVEGSVVSSNQGFLGFTNQDKGKFPFKEDFLKKFNAEILKMQASGEIQKIIDSHTNQ
ncbi:amino acid ABC transporter substrate-binding protein, PAAT family (TC 3.A.1.3.-) [Desulfobotulus alkaliphilus]|uniref:Amino acid ABC transporter substrate-binding protein, PAAT family (TC 3.A.1.3.-) n=1 Tax=Desulfobotulus alkaliphilus TaxID=622671 RepID=A0A562RPM1_9BACT|nr:ABC transporter substrate-binding protein [Desulfobotulus alkaliphilus]TWI70326.1 amino acid ABC transporter substrate-binding protein, PAAT family (TC 3.A.1.3.-) [Desulfobotulus alkaliphilus]